MLSKENRTNTKENRISYKSTVVYLLCSIFFSLSSQAQCAMCRAALESEGNTVKAEAVNDGIVYLMAIPYILVGIAGFFVYRMFSKKKG
jgi:intracellular septation protein A